MVDAPENALATLQTIQFDKPTTGDIEDKTMDRVITNVFTKMLYLIFEASVGTIIWLNMWIGN